ncbi:glycosyltransferase [Caenispirillum bisanense]|uniref:glycosyltransferase n=1 Tax=Caenispirillum bisanense TaxID=414052 RepID=UPI0031DE4F5F
MSHTACIISLTPVTDEPRVLRQSQALIKAGWTVTVAGLQGRQPAPPDWRFIPVDHVMNEPGLRNARMLRAKLLLSRWSGALSEDYYWQHAGYDGIFEHIAWVEGVRCDLAIAHDYFTAPIAARLAELSGGKFTVDCHEYAFGQYMHDSTWRFWDRPWIRSMEKRFLPKAAVVTTVCDGIADALQSDYGLPHRPSVVRSASIYRELPFRPTGETIEVLYHGIVSPMRGLEETIASVPLWRPEFRFVIRGPGPEDYLDSLRSLAAGHGVADRVRIDPPVLFNDMVPEANKSDIGFFVQQDISLQKRFTLPNKLFEYIVAGLAICVADLPEMARIVREHDLGVLVPGIAPQAIADAINSLTRERIDTYKRNSLATAKVLNWEHEAGTMLQAYERALA